MNKISHSDMSLVLDHNLHTSAATDMLNKAHDGSVNNTALLQALITLFRHVCPKPEQNRIKI